MIFNASVAAAVVNAVAIAFAVSGVIVAVTFPFVAVEISPAFVAEIVPFVIVTAGSSTVTKFKTHSYVLLISNLSWPITKNSVTIL